MRSFHSWESIRKGKELVGFMQATVCSPVLLEQKISPESERGLRKVGEGTICPLDFILSVKVFVYVAPCISPSYLILHSFFLVYMLVTQNSFLNYLVRIYTIESVQIRIYTILFHSTWYFMDFYHTLQHSVSSLLTLLVLY